MTKEIKYKVINISSMGFGGGMYKMGEVVSVITDADIKKAEAHPYLISLKELNEKIMEQKKAEAEAKELEGNAIALLKEAQEEIATLKATPINTTELEAVKKELEALKAVPNNTAKLEKEVATLNNTALKLKADKEAAESELAQLKLSNAVKAK